MKKILFFLLFIPSAIFANEVETAASQLVARLFNNSKQVSQFVFKQKTDTKDFFELYSNNNKIIIEGNNANSMAVGLSHYLKYYC
ncbi:MAG: alpha-N-acetylglucosaminidase N-terminal domain-containing protein, partial [Prevotellaceae bacterium]|nr:alpha-N-acetylglucosaminidase N-terminal domain-containing protein [Candidatus Faecinaster equi]